MPSNSSKRRSPRSPKSPGRSSRSRVRSREKRSPLLPEPGGRPSGSFVEAVKEYLTADEAVAANLLYTKDPGVLAGELTAWRRKARERLLGWLRAFKSGERVCYTF